MAPGGSSITLTVLLLSLALTTGVRPGAATPDGEAQAAAPSRLLSDGQQFTREFYEGGALKFYDATEELVRAGQFERALLRYQFLRSRIHRQAGYRPLLAQVDHRLHFLKGQLRLGDVTLASLPLEASPPALKREAPSKPLQSSTPPKSGAGGSDQAAPAPGKPGSAGTTPAAGSGPPASEANREAAPPAENPGSAGKSPEAAVGQANQTPPDQANEEPPPTPPLSRL